MLTNLLVLAILCVAVYLIAKEEITSFKNWLRKDRTALKENIKCSYEFWRAILKSKIRIVALVVILICQKTVVGMVVSIVILLGISFFLAKQQILGKIDWAQKSHQKIATIVTVSLAIVWITERLGVFSFISTIVIILGIVIFVAAVMYFLFSKKDIKKVKNQKKNNNNDNNNNNIIDVDYFDVDEDDGEDTE